MVGFSPLQCGSFVSKIRTRLNLSAATQSSSPPEYAAESADGIGQVGLGRLLMVLWGGKWIIGAFASATLAIGIYYTFFIAVPLFSATTQMVMEVRSQPVISFEDIASGTATEDEAINTELQIIESQSVLERLISELDLANDPEFNTALAGPAKYSIENIRNQLSDWISSAPKVSYSPDEVTNIITDRLRDSIETFQSRKTYILNIRVTTKDGAKSALIANRLAEIYIEEQVLARLRSTEYAISWLSNRVTELANEVKSKEDEVTKLRVTTDLTSVQALSALNSRTKSLRDRLERIGFELSNDEADLVKANALFAEKDVEGLLVELQDAPLNLIARSIGPDDPEAETLFFQRAELIISNLQSDVDRQREQAASLKVALQDLEEEVKVQSEDSVELYRLVQDAEGSRLLYETFQARLKETSLQLGLQQADSRILSEAKRSHKVSPRRSRTALFSLFLGLFLGAGVVLLRLFGNSSFRTTDELEAATGYAILGQVPKLKFGRRNKLLGFLKKNSTSHGAEAIRDIRTSILMTDLDDPPRVILQTSSLPGEGKTTVSIGLCQNLASLGKNVLLVEADIRRLTLDQYFARVANKGDVVSVASGDTELSDAVIRPRNSDFDVLLGGRYKGNAADFLSSKGFEAFLNKAREMYDFVILDTPPVLVVSDARILAPLVDAVTYSVKWGGPNKSAVKEGLKRFSSLGIRVTGLILTQVDQRKLKGYGYGQSYGSYGRGYYDK